MQPSQALLEHFSDDCKSLTREGFTVMGLHQDSIILACTEQAGQDLGYEANQLLGVNAWTLFSSESFTDISTRLIRQMDEEYLVVAKRRDGTTFNARLKVLQKELDEESVRLCAYQKIN